MGYSRFTRYELYENASRVLTESDEKIRFKNIDELKEMFSDSAKLIKGFEEKVINDSNENSVNEFNTLFEMNSETVNDYFLVETVRENIQKQIEQKHRRNMGITYMDYFRFLLKSLANAQKKIINNNFIVTENCEKVRDKRVQTFLSYAYDDKGLTLALFYYFWSRTGFLYIDWMWNNLNKNGRITKKTLNKSLKESEQLLFLRTTNSEMNIRGNNNIRQWCSWEIGNFYTNNKSKFYTSFYDKDRPKNDLLDSFSPMFDIEAGKIY